MKILWISNIVLPQLSEHLGWQTAASGSWLEDLSHQVASNENIELGVAAVGGNTFQDITIGKIRYFLLPGSGKSMLFYDKKLIPFWKKVHELFQPDLVHLHGTEYSHGLSFLRTFPNVKSVVSIQGVIARISEVSTEGFSIGTLLRYRTMKENLKLNGMIENSILLKYNARYEREILQRVLCANAVNFWDSSTVKSINPKLKIFLIDYNLRDAFYQAPKWDIQNINRYSLFTCPSGTPVKGLHHLLKALHIVKRDIPAVKLRVPGLTADNSGQIAVVSGYTKYLRDLVIRLDLTDNIVYLGKLDAAQMVENMLQSHGVIVPSAIEGTSLMLREAMFLGVPSIASFRGGMADFIRDKESGFLYDYTEYPYLANRILQLFNDDDLAMKFSKNAIVQAEAAHDRQNNPRKIIEMYRSILATYEKKN